MNENKLGRIKVTIPFIQECGHNLIDAFKYFNILPIEIDNSYASKILTYTCICEGFDEIKKGDKIPEYVFKISMSLEGIKFHDLQKC